MNLFLLIIIAISLSMDAFSLSLVYGTLDINKKDIIILSSIVGIYHFFMPFLGFLIGQKIFSFISLNSNLLVFIILSFIGIEMIVDTLRKKEQVHKMKLFQIIMFAFSVSIDSFSVGIGLNTLTNNYLLGCLIFCITSFIFTFCGLHIGKKINQILGRISTLIGGCLLILIAILYLL